ncbi:metal ABC transporter solute-binding protein, Zn/Mn family [Carboxylicivirga sp. RSCT41]|uniref:metal ABC transporter solute-binding protein, Zn/Mn family n=1 Tax=Carboxylicivirga agarovorans TaxID=3417570 RepID=UPI003D32FB9E
MKNIYFFLIIGFVLITSCTTEKKSTSKQIISVSIAPQKYFIKQLMGDTIEVNVMIPQGSDHASYAPSAAQIKKLSQSLAYIKMGHLGFEATWSDRITAASKEMKWFDLSKGIDMIQGEHHHHDHDHVCTGGIDPHTWTSPKEVKLIMHNLKSYLTELFPEHKEMIGTNYEQFISQVDEMDERLTLLQSEKPGLTFMIFHPAYTYLARAYNFEQITIEFEGKTPTPAKLKSTIELAKQKGIKTIYIQQEFDQSNAVVIANEIGAVTAQVNPLSDQWKSEMDRFITQLEKQ